MKIQYVGDGTASHQTFGYPGGCLEKWSSFTATTVPEWVQTAPPGTFLIDGKFNPGPSPKPAIKPPAKPTKPAAKPVKEQANG
jgi:hypothetical protein